MKKGKVGAIVQYCGHAGVFVADVIRVGNAVVVKACGPVTPGNIDRDTDQLKNATHHLVDFPVGGFWRPDLGIFVVPASQVRETRKERAV